MSLSARQKEKYLRNTLIHKFGEAGQEKLLASAVLVIGAGGLGAPAIQYLVASGVGIIGIADFDEVGLSNLQRQILYQENDVGKLKAQCARDKMELLNSDVIIRTHTDKVNADNILNLIQEYDIVLDCSDNAQTKFMVNDACVILSKPYVHCGVIGMCGQIMTCVPGHACLRCVTEVPRPGEYLSAKDVGILGAAAGVLGAMQAGEAIKYLTGCGEPLTDAMFVYDMKNNLFIKRQVKRNKKCPVCGTKRSITKVEPIW